MLVASRDFGATWDEDLQQRRGESIVAYYTGQAATLQNIEDGSHLYGAPFDVLAVGMQRIIPADPYVVRHLLNAFVGWLGIVFCGLLARRLFGPGTALLAMVLLATAPRYFGHSMNNPKDIPFATLATLILYAFCRLPERYPFFTWRSALGLALSLGLALNVRPGALLFLMYLGVMLLYRLWHQRRIAIRPVVMTSLWCAGISILTLAVGSVFWPWALERPLVGPILALFQVSRFEWNAYVLFQGQDIWGPDVPWNYAPQWFLITLPLVLVAGLVVSLVRVRRGDPGRTSTIGLWAAVLFPVVYVIAVRATLYDGVRHLLFVLPLMAILAAAGWVLLLEHRRQIVRNVTWVVLLAGIARPVAFELRDHPNQVVYFNELVGGPSGAYGYYDMDYWGNCLLPALRQARARVSPDEAGVAVSGWPLHIMRVDAARVPGVRVTELREPHDFEIRLARGRRREVMPLSRRQDIRARVTTSDGALLCAVLPSSRPRTAMRGPTPPVLPR
jgi:hypothetical protein